MSKIKAIQFIGTQRSGSNLLRVMINQLDNISALHPPHILTSFYPILEAYGDLSKEDNFRLLAQDVCAWVDNNPVPWEGVKLDPKKVVSLCRSPSLVELFRVIYERAAEVHKAEFWCCKSMANMNYFEQLETLENKPFYLYLFRDGRDVALSFKKAYVGEKHIYSIAEKWKKDQKTALNVCAKVPKERLMKICYEDLIRDSDGVLRNFCHALGLKNEANFSEYQHSQEAKKASQAGEMWQNLTKPVLKNNFNKYKKGLTEEEIKIFESVAGEELQALGYKLENSDSSIRESYSSQEIEEFKKENEVLKKKVIKETSDHEKAQKRWHESFMSKMKQKVSVLEAKA